ncbi:MAG: class I SAM-dependent methyltransferase [Arenicellales bacterium]
MPTPLIFKDYFSDQPSKYNQFRPDYPESLFCFLASISDNNTCVWDCATGNGQAACSLAKHFVKVIATDASQAQIDQAVQCSGVQYHVATAEQSHIQSNSIDLITVAQAFHWFDQGAFSTEASRVLKRHGLIAVWTYNLLSIHPEVDDIIYRLYDDTLGDFWAFERKIVETGYKDVSLPFKPASTPLFEMTVQWDLSQLIGYLCTWSAVKKYQLKYGTNPVETIYVDLLNAWGNADVKCRAQWPLSVRVWKKIN